jgi:hypothetical protein
MALTMSIYVDLDRTMTRTSMKIEEKKDSQRLEDM